MSIKRYLIVSGFVFFVVGVLHLLRLVFQWPAHVGGWRVPEWLSYVGVPFAWGLSIWAYRLHRGSSLGGNP